MKKIFSLLTGFLLILLVAGCGEENTQIESKPDFQPPVNKIERNADDKILMAYFSVPETDNPKNMNLDEENSTVIVDGEVFGNTQYVAQIIQQSTGANIFRIEPVTPYPTNHGELEQVATKEKQSNALPEISAKIENFDSYKIIFVGYPIWYGDMPRILYSFFKSYDFSGKTIVPFITSGGAGFANSINEIQSLQPNAKVIEGGLALNRNVIQNSEDDIKNWLKNLGF